MQEYHHVAYRVSQLMTSHYSTSFYNASRFFRKDIRRAVFNIYGFVRLADEIVDTFHDHNKEQLLDRFVHDLEMALEEGISLNPVLHSFALTVRKYGIDRAHIDAFLKSMRKDLTLTAVSSKDEIHRYIHGSAEVVGLMCLKVFCDRNEALYRELEPGAIRLGAAFQKVNFLRDLKDDTQRLHRTYFTELHNQPFSDAIKEEIVEQIKEDFRVAQRAIGRLPLGARTAVTIAYLYYRTLLKKLHRMPAARIADERIRTGNHIKLLIIPRAILVSSFNLWGNRLNGD